MKHTASKTLVCILCETRAHELTWNPFRKYLLEPLQADLALCIGMPENYHKSNNFYQNAKFIWTSPEYEDYGEGFEEARKWFHSNENWRLLLKVKNFWLGGIKDPYDQQPASAGILIYYRWLLLKQLLEQNLLKHMTGL